MSSRREFIKLGALGASVLPFRNFAKAAIKPGNKNMPLVISTWKFGMQANEAAWDVLSKNGRALDAVEAGVKVPEGDPEIQSVGYGGRPDRDGRVTLDACIMDEKMNIGSVACLGPIKHPVFVALVVL